jgi:membrane-bound lytic murein transglycosylase D
MPSQPIKSMTLKEKLFSLWTNQRFRKKWIGLLVVIMVGFLLMPPSINQVPPPVHHTPLSSEESESSRSIPTSIFDPFPFPDALKPQVEFWKMVFTRYTTEQVILHDSWYLNVVYEVIDLNDFSSEAKGREAVKAAQKKYERLLTKMAKKWDSPQSMADTEQQVYTLFQNLPEISRFKKEDAKTRVRAQVGQADRFKEGIIRAGNYLDAMKQILADYELPETLVYLPLIESAFNPLAQSYVGAAGPWQFMKSTGKQYNLTINALVDERKDPLRATQAAAQLLAHNYEKIQSWPLAITAYNHGLQGMKNAVKEVGSDDIGDIIEQYNGSQFGFASRNFYPEFLAAIDVCLRYTEYFGEIELDAPLTLTQISIPDYVSGKTLEHYTGFTIVEIKQLNPALHPSVFSSGNFIPKHYELNIPADQKEAFEQAYAAIPQSVKYQYLAVKAKHTIKKGETLSSIAQKYGTSVRAIASLNNIKNTRKIIAGKVLKIPGGYIASADEKASTSSMSAASSAIAASSADAISSNPNLHRVEKGQTLTIIAKKHHTTISALASLNNISNPRRLQPGQLLKIPQKTASSTQAEQTTSFSSSSVHRVEKGQTLIAIAKQYNTTAQAIASLNKIKNPRKIRPGQVLKIPKG